MEAYHNPAGILAATVILQLVAASCVLLRLYSSHKKGIRFGASEWLILGALISSIGLTVITIYGVAARAIAYPALVSPGESLEDVDALLNRIIIARHLEVAYMLLGVFATGLIKLSFTFLYYRIFNKPLFRRVFIIWIILLILWTTASCLAGLLVCGSHFMAPFDSVAVYNQYCGAALPIGIAIVGSDVGTDLVTIIIPIPMIWSLHMSTNKKLLIIATFMIGGLSLGASIAKAYIYIIVASGWQYTVDAILAFTGLSLWNLIEVQIGIIAACGPSLRPVIGEIFPIASFKKMLETLRDRWAQRRSTSRATDHTNNLERARQHAKTASEDNLVPHGYLGKSTVEAGRRDGDFEMQSLGGDKRGNVIYVKKGVWIESSEGFELKGILKYQKVKWL